MRQFINAGRPYGWLYLVLLAVSTSLVLFLANTMGDCGSSVRCHEHTGTQTVKGMLFATPVVLLFAAITWVPLAALNFVFREEGLGKTVRRTVMVVATLLAAWLSLEPLFGLIIWWTRL